jgi:hypothetical protein
MTDRRTYLKIKIKSLAAEAKIIRKEERKQKGRLREGLYLHRLLVVRAESRLSQIAYGFIRGRAYSQIEKNAKPFDKKRVLSLIEKFGVCHDYDNESDAIWQARARNAKIDSIDWVNKAFRAAV